MFTGLIETKGTVAGLQKHPGGARFSVAASQLTLTLGESVAVNGTCVTVVELGEGTFTVDLVPETLSRSNLGLLQVGDEVNLERAMEAGARFGGHWVQGHIDCLGQVRSRRKVGDEELLEVTIPFEVGRFIVPQGSITIDGVSLTVVDAEKDRVKVALIPFTREMTTLGTRQPMDVVNIELDIVSKYLDRHIGAYLARVPRAAEESAPHREALSRSDATRSRVPMSRAATAGHRTGAPSARNAGSGPRAERPRVKWNDEAPDAGRGRDERPRRDARSADARPKYPRDSKPRGFRSREEDDRPRRVARRGDDERPRRPRINPDRPPRTGTPERTGRTTGRAASASRETGAKRAPIKRATAAKKPIKRSTTARVTKTTRTPAKRTTKTTRSPKRK